MKKILLSLILWVSLSSVASASVSLKEAVKTVAIAGLSAEAGYLLVKLTNEIIYTLENFNHRPVINLQTL